MKVFLSPSLPNKAIVYYTLQLIALNKQFHIAYVSEPHLADVTIGVEPNNDIQVSKRFFQLLAKRETNFTKHFSGNIKTIQNEAGQTDYLSTIFFYTNCVQEFFATQFDSYGRFSYANSLQSHFKNTHENFVQQLIDEFCTATKVFNQQKTENRKSAFFLTHDIDDIFKAKNEDGKFALLHGKWWHIPRLLWNHYLGIPDLLNMQQIINLEKQFGFCSTFFWLPLQNRQNADYNFSSKLIEQQYALVKQSGCSNGIHKAWSDNNFEDELKVFPEKITANRYHFLKFTVHDFLKLEAAGIEIDTSLGYSEQFGFRNNYGLPFHPFDLTENRVVKTLEVPMHVMDRTFFNQKISPPLAAANLQNWMSQNLENTVFTINWHNNFFTDLKYKGYKELYLQLLQFFHVHQMKCYTLNELKKDFFRPEFFSLPEHLQ